MSEIIQKIVCPDDGKNLEYKIETNKQTIILKMDDESQCCEDFDLTQKDKKVNILKFIGSEIIDIKGLNLITDDKLDYHVEFIIETNNGNLELIAYNYHNGYYCHSVECFYNNKHEELSI